MHSYLPLTFSFAYPKIAYTNINVILLIINSFKVQLPIDYLWV